MFSFLGLLLVLCGAGLVVGCWGPLLADFLYRLFAEED